MTELLLIRHAHPLSGHADPPLSPTGRRQAVEVGRWLAGEKVDVVVASPMARALETAQLASHEIGLPVTAVLDDLREWDLDHEDGMYVALEELGSTNPRLEALREGRYEDFVPAIDRTEFLERAAGAFDALVDTWPDKRIAVFSHGGLINAVMATVLGLRDTVFFFLPEYTSVSTVRVMPGGRRVIHALNGTAHQSDVLALSLR